MWRGHLTTLLPPDSDAGTDLESTYMRNHGADPQELVAVGWQIFLEASLSGPSSEQVPTPSFTQRERCQEKIPVRVTGKVGKSAEGVQGDRRREPGIRTRSRGATLCMLAIASSYAGLWAQSLTGLRF